MNFGANIVYVNLNITEGKSQRIAIDNVPDSVTCKDFLKQISSIIFENLPKNNHQNQNFNKFSLSDYCLKQGDKILLENDFMESNEIDVIIKPQEITNFANVCLAISFFLMFAVPVLLFYYFQSILFSVHSFIISSLFYAIFVYIFDGKKNYKSLSLQFKPKKNSLGEAIILLIKSFHPQFRLEDVLIDN